MYEEIVEDCVELLKKHDIRSVWVWPEGHQGAIEVWFKKETGESGVNFEV